MSRPLRLWRERATAPVDRRDRLDLRQVARRWQCEQCRQRCLGDTFCGSSVGTRVGGSAEVVRTSYGSTVIVAAVIGTAELDARDRWLL